MSIYNNTTSTGRSPRTEEEREDMPLDITISLKDEDGGSVVFITGYVTYRAEGWVTRWNGRMSPPARYMENKSTADRAIMFITQTTDMSERDAEGLIQGVQIALLAAHSRFMPKRGE